MLHRRPVTRRPRLPFAGPRWLLLAALAIAAAGSLLEGGRQADAIAATASGAADRERGTFPRCRGQERVTCVVDGDTFWYRGEKIRIADINTPEIGSPGCAAEARLGAAATLRLQQLLNTGSFTLEPVERATDRYGRSLRVVTRNGRSLGRTLEAEGLAEPWQGHRGNWC
jgi:micrococcal nuclease